MAHLRHESIEVEVLLVTAGDVSRYGPPSPEVLAFSTGGVDGFAPLCNAGARRSLHPYLLFLNDDVETPNPFVGNLLKCIAEEDVFAAAPPVLIREGERLVDESETEITLRKGFLWTGHKPGAYPGNVLPPHEIPYAVGACVLLKKSVFMSLGGFDERFSPAYWEDVDLSYRAIKRGYRVLHCPSEPVFHRRGETTARIPKAEFQRLFYRNQLLFHWKNLHSPALYRAHRAAARLKTWTSVVKGDLAYRAAYREAGRIAAAQGAVRAAERTAAKRSDEDILRQFHALPGAPRDAS